MNEELEATQMTIEQAEMKIKRMETVDKLLENPLFKEIVTDGYLGDDAVRLTMNIKPGGDNDVVYALLAAKATFSRYVHHIIADGENAIQALQENKELLASLNAGD